MPDLAIPSIPVIENPTAIDLAVPHLDEYFGLWAIHAQPFRAAVDRVNGLDLRAHVTIEQTEPRASASSAYGAEYHLTPGGVAIVSISGPMMKYVSSLSGGTSTVQSRRAVRAAVANKDVSAIVLQIDSPGGTVSGTFDLADDVAAANRKKPVVAYIEDMGASAAYAVASQCRAIFANRTALVGSIGTYAVIVDQSAQAAMIGWKVHVLSTGKFKGAGVAGTEVTAEQLAEWQRVVDELNEHFITTVAAGRRGLSEQQVRDLADGRVHVGQAAHALGLIDGIETFDAVVAQVSPTKQKGKRTMSQETTVEAPVAATLDELKVCCPGATDAWVLDQLGRKATLDQARSAWAEQQQAELATLKTKVDEQTKETGELKAQIEAAKKKPGVEPLGGGEKPGGQTGGDPEAAFEAAVEEKMKTGVSKSAAVAAVVKGNPELQATFIEAHNATVGPSSYCGPRA